MVDFLTNDQKLDLARREFLKLTGSIDKSITREQSKKILQQLFTTTSDTEMDRLLYDEDKDLDNTILFDELINVIKYLLNKQIVEDESVESLPDEQEMSKRWEEYGKRILALTKAGTSIDHQMAKLIAEECGLILEQ